jgi:hypothetical protein
LACRTCSCNGYTSMLAVSCWLCALSRSVFNLASRLESLVAASSTTFRTSVISSSTLFVGLLSRKTRISSSRLRFNSLCTSSWRRDMYSCASSIPQGWKEGRVKAGWKWLKWLMEFGFPVKGSAWG